MVVQASAAILLRLLLLDSMVSWIRLGSWLANYCYCELGARRLDGATLKFSVISCSAMVGWRCVWDDRGGGKR